MTALAWLGLTAFPGVGLAQSGPRSIIPDADRPGIANTVAPGRKVTPGMQPGPNQAATIGSRSQTVRPGFDPGSQGNPGNPGELGNPGGSGAGILGKLPASLDAGFSGPGRLGQDRLRQGRLGVVPSTALATGDASALIDLFDAMKGPMPSPELQAIAQEYLLDRSFQDLGAQVGLARAEALYRLGFIEDAAGAVVAQEGKGVARRAATARMLLAIGQRRIACERADVSGFPKGASEGPTFELLRILAYCKLADGNAKAAGLIAGLLREQGGGDALFAELMKAKPRERRVLRARFKRLRPVHVALFARAGIPVPARFVAKADPALLARLARDARLVETRTAAAERAVTLGLLAIKDLENLYGAIDMSGADPARLISRAGKKLPVSPVVARAQMITLMIDGSDQDRVSLARAAFLEARRAGVARAVVEFVGEELAGIENPEGFGPQAIGTAIEILTMADRPEAALAWLDAGEMGDAGTGKAILGPIGIYRGRALIKTLMPDTDLDLGEEMLGNDGRAIKISKRDRAFIRTQAGVLEALGDDVPPVLERIAGPVPGVSDLGDISSPVEMLRLLAPFSGRSYAKMALGQLVRGLGALRALGLGTDARRVAVDALIARG